MKSKLTYKSKRNIIIAAVILVAMATISTATYFFIQGNDDASAFSNETQMSGTEGNSTEQDVNTINEISDNENNNNTQTQNGQNGQQAGEPEVVTNDGDNNDTQTTTNNPRTGEVPTQDYVTERIEHTNELVQEDYMVEWWSLAMGASTTTRNLSIVRPIISQTKSADKTAVVIGDTITYTITVENKGNDDGTALVQDNIPEGTEFVEGSILLNGEATEYTAEDLSKGIKVDVAKRNEKGQNGKATISFEVIVTAQGNTAEIITVDIADSQEAINVAPNNGTIDIINRANVIKNQAKVNDIPTNEVKNPVVTYSKSVNKRQAKVGDELTYTITVTNNTEVDGTVFVQDSIPDGTKFVENSLTIAREETDYNEEYLENGFELEVPANSTRIVEFKVEVLANAIEIENIAYVNGQPTEPTLTKITYTITYKIVGDHFTNDSYKVETHYYGDAITAATEPSKTGYTFSGWSTIPSTMPANNVVVTGSFTKNRYGYTVEHWYEKLNYEKPEDRFVKDEGVTDGPVSALYGEKITTYTDKAGSAYVLSHVTPADAEGKVSLTITENAANNVIKVYYIRNSFEYKVKYYKDSINSANELGKTDAKKEKVETVMTNELVTEDFGSEWINEYRPTGYQNGEVQEYIKIQANNDNVINVVYKPRRDIKYTVNYYYNEVEDTSKKETKTTTFGSKVESVTNNSNSGEWSVADKSTSLPYAIENVDGNIINIYYIKPVITVKKQNTTGTVEYGDKITYTITATNSGYKEGIVTIGDTKPEGTVIEGAITATGYDAVTEQQLTDGIELTVPARGTAKIEFTVKVENVKPGEKITNTPVVDGEEDEKNTVTNDVEKTIKIGSKSETLESCNIVLVLDKSGSMKYASKEASTTICKEHKREKDHKNSGCVQKDGKWYKPKQRMEIAKEVTAELIRNLNLPDTSDTNTSSITVISFAYANTTSVVGTANKATDVGGLIEKVNNLTPNGGTVMSAALALANTEIAKLKEAKPDNKNVVLFISDGEPDGDHGNIPGNASVLKNNATVYTVAFDTNIAILRDTIASGSDKYYTTNDTTTLSNIIKSVKQEIAGEPSPKQTLKGKVELTGVYADEQHPITIKVDGVVEHTLTSLPTDTTGKIILESGKYYLDASKFEAQDDIEVTYFSN